MSTQVSCPDPARLKKLLDGALPAGEQSALHEHLDSCLGCQRRLEGLVAGGESWTEAARHLRWPPAEGAALEEAVARLEAEGDLLTPGAGPGTGGDMNLDFLGPPDTPGHLGRLGHYKIIELVGKGGFGLVFKAFDAVLDRVVALKVLAPHLASSATARRRFTREAKAAAAVSHDHVVGIHAVEEKNDPPYLVMQFVHGISLQERLDRSGPLELKEILRIGMQAASGLAAAHAQGLIHRDIKPANILLENGVERVKLTDFGLARAADDASLSQSGVITGTPQYMAPEQACGETVDHRADLFSLGSVLYALCTGRPPFRASTSLAVLKRVCEEAPRPIREINPDIPEWLCAIIAKLHAKDPNDRFQSAQEVAELLGQHLAHLQQPSLVPMPATPRLSRRLQFLKRRFIKEAAFFLAIVGIGAAVWYVYELRRDALLIVEFDEFGLHEVTVKRNGEVVGVLSPKTGDRLSLEQGGYDFLMRDAHGFAVNRLKVRGRSRSGSFDSPFEDGSYGRWHLGPGEVLRVRMDPEERLVLAEKRYLQGTWTAVSADCGLEPIPPDRLKDITMTFTGHRLRRTLPGGYEEEGAYRLNPHHKPKMIVLRRGEDNRGMGGIYQLEGDRLTVCMSELAVPLPTTFAPLPTAKVMVVTLQRNQSPRLASPSQIRRFESGRDTVITRDSVSETPDGWKIENKDYPERTVRLFELRDQDVENHKLDFRVQVRTETQEPLENRRISAGLEMAFRPQVVIKVDPAGNTVTEKTHSRLGASGNTNWAWYEAEIECRSRPDVISLNLRTSGIGTVWIKDVQLVWVPLPGPPK